jgi:hypothetical protein
MAHKRPLDQEALSELTTSELLALSRAILAELKARGVIRSGNAPAGDYAELLVRQATGGELAPTSQKSWDVVTPDMERLQVEARVVTNPRKRGEPLGHLSSTSPSTTARSISPAMAGGRGRFDFDHEGRERHVRRSCRGPMTS